MYIYIHTHTCRYYIVYIYIYTHTLYIYNHIYLYCNHSTGRSINSSSANTHSPQPLLPGLPPSPLHASRSSAPKNSTTASAKTREPKAAFRGQGSSYINMYVYLCVCMYIYIHIYNHKYICVYLCIYVCMHAWMYDGDDQLESRCLLMFIHLCAPGKKSQRLLQAICL